MFTTTDPHQQFAEYFDIPALKPYAYLLSKKLGEGHICITPSQIEEEAELLPEKYQELLSANPDPAAVPLIAGGGRESEPFILFQSRLYIQRYFRYESVCLQRIMQFVEAGQSRLEERMQRLVEQRDFVRSLFPLGAPPYDSRCDWQLVAALHAALNQLTIITGGPGTGKTTTVARLLGILHVIEPGLRIALAAPTGKAAARMAESLRSSPLADVPGLQEVFEALEPSTIHRLLKTKPGTPYFRHDAANPLPHDLIIIDESSMIDVALFAKLLQAIGPQTRLVLLGDKDQLAAVEAGSLFGDLCQAQPLLNTFSPERRRFLNQFAADAACGIPEAAVIESASHPLFQHVVELQYSRRFSADHGIGPFSKAIIANDVDALQFYRVQNVDKAVRIDAHYSEDCFESIAAEYADYLQEPDIFSALRKLGNCRILCALREGSQGIHAMNTATENYLKKRGLLRLQGEFYENRPIMLSRNYYEHGLFNGDTGIIRRDAEGTPIAWFDDGAGSVKGVLPGYLADAETAFAITIHKSQGSEFNKVLVVLPDDAGSPILTRELLYTGVTRARSEVIVQAPETVLMHCAARRVERASGIARRFLNNEP
jgi:exodeoxyribonuclease V alpha subunit